MKLGDRVRSRNTGNLAIVVGDAQDSPSGPEVPVLFDGGSGPLLIDVGQLEVVEDLVRDAEVEILERMLEMPDLRNTPSDMENPIIIPNVSAEELKEVFSALKLKGGTVFPDGTFTIHRFLTTVHGKWGSGADGSLFVTVDSHRDDVEKALTGFLASVRGERK